MNDDLDETIGQLYDSLYPEGSTYRGGFKITRLAMPPRATSHDHCTAVVCYDIGDKPCLAQAEQGSAKKGQQ